MLKKGMCISIKSKNYLVLKNENPLSDTISVVSDDGEFCEISKLDIGVLSVDLVMTDRETLESMLFYAFRYALGRATYASHDVVRAIKAHSNAMSHATRLKIIKEIQETKQKGQHYLGHDCDARAWESLVEYLVENLDN